MQAVAGRDPKAEFKQARIPGARYFDLNGVADHSTELPHMLPSEAQFAASMDALDITNDSAVVVYDGAGIFSAPRILWTFKAFGHSKYVSTSIPTTWHSKRCSATRE